LNEARGSRRNGAAGATALQRKLRPGPGRSREEVAAHQRARLLTAIVELVAERGYKAATTRELTKRAGVSTRDFYAHFSDKEECFLTAYDLIVRESVRELLAAMKDEGEWCDPLRSGFETFANQLVEQPDAARLALVEAFAAGPAALERMRRTDGLFETLLVKSFARGPGGTELPPLLAKGIVAGGARVVRSRLLSEHPGELKLDGAELMEWALSFRSEAAAALVRRHVAPQRPRSRRIRARPGRVSAELQVPDADDERALILSAATQIAASEGYEALTVPRIRSLAGISRQSFDTHFDGVADCFLAALGERGSAALAEAMPTFEAAESWPAGVHGMMVVLCERLAADPVLAKLAFLEVFSPGPEGARWRGDFIANLGGLLRRGAPAGSVPTQFAAEASIGGIWGLIHHHVATGQASSLPSLSPVLSLLLLAPAIGAGPAAEAIEAELEAEVASPVG
jgi:AcrR family transcriptional regulator